MKNSKSSAGQRLSSQPNSQALITSPVRIWSVPSCVCTLPVPIENCFGVLFLDSQNGVIAFEELFQGSINTCSIYVRIIVQKAMQYNASSVILAHNHPSSNPVPSAADKALTLRIKAALLLVEINTHDHMIVTGNTLTSFAESGLL
ncbi:TPA: DNA repair protein RadC [Klebsiella pneumoniae]|nr:DNA repair protein RadC [Klebsiella pneumoniae]HBU8302932.1 DNA repair protein RadC [Klebsiella pneumoniae]